MARAESIDIREAIIQVALEQEPKHQSEPALSQTTLLEAVVKRLARPHDREFEQAILTQWHDLMRTGYLAWGLDINSPNQPFFHFTERGRRALGRFSRDPGNPAGYFRHLSAVSILNPTASSYLTEGLDCYVAGHYKAAAVMIGAAAESLILELRDVVVERLAQTHQNEPRSLLDVRVKTLFDALNRLLDAKKAAFPRDLREEFEGLWMAFAHHIRATRNEAGHPTSVDPVTEEAVHASFLMFPDLARLQNRLGEWVTANL